MKILLAKFKLLRGGPPEPLPSPSGEGLIQKAPEGVPEVIFGIIFEVIFWVILDTAGAIKSRLRLYDARMTK